MSKNYIKNYNFIPSRSGEKMESVRYSGGSSRRELLKQQSNVRYEGLKFVCRGSVLNLQHANKRETAIYIYIDIDTRCSSGG